MSQREDKTQYIYCQCTSCGGRYEKKKLTEKGDHTCDPPSQKS